MRLLSARTLPLWRGAPKVPRPPTGRGARAAAAAAFERSLDAARPFSVGLCLPMRGAAGIWGPSCLASAQLAEAEVNRLRGIAGRPCELRPFDASDESPDVEDALIDLVDDGAIEALVGMCTSSVRQRITGAIGGRIPFVYTCLYEGGERTPGVYAIGETAQRQIPPSIAWLAEHDRRSRWMLLGNDYVWPRESQRIARRCIAEHGGRVVDELFLPFGVTDHGKALWHLHRSGADAVLISMVGQEAVEFNRAFARAGLQRSVLRLSCAIEENLLLAIGADNTENLYAALAYFATLQGDANAAFKERYHSRFGERAPTLNSLGQSTYEGIHFLSALMDRTGRARTSATGLPPLPYPSARAADGRSGHADRSPIYLARAEGHLFRVVARF